MQQQNRRILMVNIGTLPDERMAGLSADLFHKLQSGALTLDELALFCKRRNPFGFERNEHGHVVLTITGLDLTGAQEIKRLDAAKYNLGMYFKQCLLSTAADSYDKNHRLVAGQTYKVALMPGNELPYEERTAENLRERGMKHYGYGKPLAGLIPRIRESVSDKQMEEMLGSPWYIAALHDPIMDSGGDPLVLGASRHGDGRRLDADWGRPGPRWNDSGLFAFPVPAK